jgi:hypothetical protein
VCSVVSENLIGFDYGPGSRGASSVISRLGGYTDGRNFVVPYVRWQTRRELAVTWIFLVSCLGIYLSSKSVCTFVLCRLQA